MMENKDITLDECVSNLEEEEEKELTAERALQAIEDAWLNEKFAPEILPHQSDLIDCMIQQIAYMEENIQKLEKHDIRIEIHRMELDRIRYVMSSYLRTRLDKIERYTVHILSEEAKRIPDECYLTPQELRFAKEFLTNVETLFRTIALQHMPNNFQTFEIAKFCIKPHLQAHVFLRVNKRISGIMTPGMMDDELDFEPDSQHIIQYDAIADLVKNGVVQLI